MSNVHDKNIKLIYDKLTSKGVDMGTLEETTKALRSDPRNGRLLYDMGTKHGYDMGSYEEFEEAMGLPKFQAPLLYGEEPIEVNSAQPKAEEPKKEEDYLTSDMPEEAEAEEEYDFNREVLKDYVPQFKNEIKEKFPNARMYGFTRPTQMSTTGTGGITPNPNYGTPITLTEEEKAQRDSLDYQLKRGQITKEQYADQISAINKQATDRLNDQFSEDTLNASAALHLMTQAQKRVKLVDGRKKSRIVNTFRGIGHFDYAGLNPTLQYIDAYRSFALLNKVAENPDAELSESEQYLLQAIVTNNAVNDTFQTNMAERIGQGLPESMAFMAQFALTGGVGSAVGKLAKEGVEEVIKKGLKNATRRLYDDGFKGLVQKGLDRTLNTVIPGVVGATTAAATQTVLNPASLASGTYERAAGTAEYTLAPDGTPIATGEVTGRMGLDEAFAKEFGAQTIEQLSERAGASLGIALGAGKAVAKTTGKTIASKVPGVQKAADAFVDFADNMKKTKVGDLVGKAAEWLENKDLGVKALAQKVGWNGTIEEWYEEQANTVLNALFVGDEELSALFNGQRQLETFLSVAVVGGATRLLSVPAAIEQRAEVRKEKQNLKNTISDIEKRVRGNSTMSHALKAVATAVDTGTVEDVALAINEANRQLNLDTDTKRMFLDYASARMMSNMWHSNDRRQASKLAEGVYKEVEARTHKQSGTITVAEYTDAQGNKQNVDIIDGVIIRDGDKKIDSTLSDRSVVIRFQDGTTKMVPSKSLGNIVEEIDPAQYRAKLADASVQDMESTFSSEYSARTNKHGVYYNEDGSLDYYHATPAQTALSLIDELGSAEAAAEYAANQLIGLQGPEMTSAEGGDGMSIETQNALSKWQAVSGLLAGITAYNAQQAAAAEGKAPEGVEPMENPLPVDAAAPARNLRAGDRLRLTLDNGEMAEATIGGKTADGNYIVDFEDNVTIGGKKGASHELTPEVIAAMQYVEEVQEGEEELQAEQTPEQDDVSSYKDMVIGRIPLKADGSRNWEAATPTEAAQAVNAERDGDFDASIAFAQQMAQNCANAVADLANTELEVEDPTNADMVAAAEAERKQAIASMQKTADFWDEVTSILTEANSERTKPAEQEAPAVETATVEESPAPEVPETPEMQAGREVIEKLRVNNPNMADAEVLALVEKFRGFQISKLEAVNAKLDNVTDEDEYSQISAERNTLLGKIAAYDAAIGILGGNTTTVEESAPVVEEVAQPEVAEDNTPAQTTPTYRLSDEIDENGRQFVETSDGNIEFGMVESESGLTAAPILLSEGMITNPQTNDGYGLVHIEARHGDQIRKAGYKSVVDFIEEVAKGYTTIREGKKRDGQQTYLLQLTDKHNNTLMVELASDGTYWNINTAGIFKTSYGKNGKVVYNRYTTAKQTAESVEVSQESEQSGSTETPSISTPASPSTDKTTTSEPEKQISAQENVEVAEETAATQPEQVVEEIAQPSAEDVQPEATEERKFFEQRLKEQGEISPVMPRGKYKLEANLDTKGEKEIPVLQHVIHQDGFAVATDAQILVADKGAYQSDKEGKWVDVKGQVVEPTSKLAWQVVVNTEADHKGALPTGISPENVLTFVGGLKAKLEEEWQKRKDSGEKVGVFKTFVENFSVMLPLPNEEVVALRVDSLEKFARAAQHLGATEIMGRADNRPIFVQTDKGVALLMPVFLDYYNKPTNYFAYEQLATAAEETPVEEIATEEKAEENKEVSDVNSEKDTNFVGESEATPEETTEEEITVEMIENTDLDEVIKVMAIDYLNGNVNVATKAAYDAVKDYVRNISTVRPADSTDAGRAQLGEGADDAGSLASGQSRGVSGDLDSREDGGVVSDGDGVRSEAGEDDLAEPSGSGGDNELGTGGHEPDVVSGIVSSGRVRSGSDSERRPSSRNPRRGKGSSNGLPNQDEGGRRETQRRGDTRDSQEREVKEQEVKDDLARHIQELKDILANPMGEAKGALLDVTSVFGMFGVNAIKVMGATAKIGMDLVKLGYYKFKKWSAAMHEQLDGVFHSQTELTDELIDEFIRAMWDTSFKYRGEVRKISEWASLLEAEQLRAMMRMGIEEKRKLQKAAENEPTILGDIENIRKSLPFLLPAQQEDVEKAEFQFFDESHKDAAYGYGKGYMFTNGTGTGKTYTGLGIIKRFIKQGKGRILIVTASGEKIDDWVKDAKNLGITATRLADTKSKGKGVVVTQYANLRQNYELLKDEFDLIVYDESHKLMENQAGKDTNAVAAHYMITNRDAEQAILRTLQDTPLWEEPRKLEEELKELVSLLDAKKLTSEQLKRAEQLGGKVVMEERVSAIRARLTEIAKLQEAKVKKQLQDPNKRAAAEAAVARTKVVFLSATPFNTALNLDYVEGYIFSYPPEEGKERDREKDKERFIMDKFPSSHRRAKQGVVRIDETQIQDADAVTAEEIAFSDYLQNSLHTMSGRGLDSEWDYSREFPKLEVTGARLVNAAIVALTTGKYSALRPYFKHLLDDYAQSTAFFEVIKTAASIERIKEHIALGRKVVVFHRRMSSTEPLEPPFARGLDNADHDDRASAEMIHAFRREFAELLAWEQSLDYRFPQDILMEAFATEEEKAKYQKEQEEYELKQKNYDLGIEKKKPKMPKSRSAKVGVFNGNETELERHKAVDAFNTDGGECSLLVVQVAAGKEGISLHDKTGKHQRVMMSMQLPESPIEFVQAEGRIYRVGNKSNAIFEYPVLGIDQEIIGFAAKINGRAATTENLALGSRARGLRNSISRAMLASREIPVSPTQGVGGKQLDSREEWEKTDYDGAIEAYNNRKTESEATTDFNEQDTPEPIGYKMMEWARPEAGESILEPAAGTGTMAQYAPQKSRLTAIEIITKKFATLITKVGGSGRKLLNGDFMGFDKRNKFDCVVMNTPHTGEVAVNALIAPQGVPQKEFEFLDKVFGHINEGGRVVALIEEKSADATIKAVTNLGRNRVVVGEVKLPAFAFPSANGGTATRVVVFDVVSNEALRSAMPEKVSFDLSGETTPQGLFEAMRDVQMPARTIDKVARLAKKLQKFEAKFKSFKNVVQRGKNYRTGKMEREVDFNADRASLSVRTAQGDTYRIRVGGYYFNLYIQGNAIAAGNMGEITNLCNVYKSLKQITDAQTDEEFRYLTRNYEPKTYPEIRDFLEVCKDAISTALGKTESQIINIAEGRVENELRGELTFKQMKDAFEGLSHGDVTLDDLSKKVFEVVGKIEGLRFYTKSGVPGSTVAYYTPKENAIVINEDTWNSLRLTDGIKAQTVVHEMIHAVTCYYLDAYERGVSFSAEINQACQDILDVYKAITADRSFEAGLMQSSKQGDNATYGLTSAQEMIAELANPKFRVQLKLKKLWRQLVNGIKKLLGINLEMGDAQETTALETLENALDTLLSNYDPEYYSQYVGFVNASPNPMEFVKFRTSEEISQDYPNWLEGTTTDSGKHTTQVEGTRKTYKKVGDWIADNLGMGATILDASSGMGYGTQDLRDRGFNIEDVEPYQSEERKQNNPATYSSYDDIEKSYDFIISNAVLNVIPDDWRADVLHNMAAHLKEGGKLFINTRKAGEEKTIKDKIELDSAQEVLVKRNGRIASYQRFFTPLELKEYVENELGKGYTVEVANMQNSGTSGLAAVVVTKNEATLSERSGADAGNSSSEGLLDGGNVHLSRQAFTRQQDAAKIEKNTATTKQSLSRILREGGITEPLATPQQAVRALGRGLKLRKSASSLSYYGDFYEGDFDVNNTHLRLRLSTHPANGAKFGNVGANHKVSVVILKNGKHQDRGPHNGFEEYVYDPNRVSLEDAANAILNGVAKLLETGEYGNESSLAEKKEYPTYEAGNVMYRTKAEYTDSQRVIAAQAQTLSTAEIEEYVNEVAKSLPEGVKVVVTNSVESGDREHTGWYDMGTDTVYINADMCDNTADVDATIVHELVGHRSMPTAIARVIGTKNVTDRITLYTKLATMLPKELLDRVMAKTAAEMNLGVAVDEVLAEAVENADLIKPSLWQRICSEVRAFFRRVLNRGISLTDGDIKYMFWLAAHNINNDAEFVAAEEMRYRTGVAEFKRNSALPTEEQQEYDSAVISKSQKFVEEWVDSLNPLKKLQETVAKHHGELKSWENAYDIELGRASRTMARSKMMGERFLKPLITAISAFTNNGISREEVNYYMIAKHGLERNEYARKQAHQELNNTILEAVQKVATDSEYEGLSDVEKATVIKSMFADYLDHLNDEEIANALGFFTNNPDTDYIGVVVALDAVPLEDVSGLTGLAEKLNEDPDAKPEEIFTEFAESLVEEFESENAEAVNTLWDKVRDLTNATLLYQTEGGILSQEQYIHLRSMYRYYIPLRGWDGPNSRDYYEYSTSPARHQTVVKAAKGRKSLAEDPIANMANMLQSAVTIVEKNASKQAFVRMALNRSDSSVVRVVKVRYEKRKNASTGKTEWVAVFPDFNEDASAEEIDAAIAGFDEQTKQLVAEGKARVKRSQVDVGVRVLPANLNDHYVKAMVNGEEVVVIVNGSPAAALALNGTNVPAYDQALQNTIGKATRFFARTHTTWAPKFVVTNFLRDYGYGSITSIVKYGTKYAQKFQRNIGRAMWVLPKMHKEGITKLSEEQLNDHSLITNPTLRYFVEFLTNGGETGFSQSLTTEEWKKEIEKQVNALNGKFADFGPCEAVWADPLLMKLS